MPCSAAAVLASCWCRAPSARSTANSPARSLAAPTSAAAKPIAASTAAATVSASSALCGAALSGSARMPANCSLFSSIWAGTVPARSLAAAWAGTGSPGPALGSHHSLGPSGRPPAPASARSRVGRSTISAVVGPPLSLPTVGSAGTTSVILMSTFTVPSATGTCWPTLAPVASR